MSLELVLKAGKDVGKRVVFTGNVITVGSSPAADMVVADDPLVEPCHFVIEKGPSDDFQVRDLDSRHGTFLNGRRITLARLGQHDVIRAGLTVFETLLPFQSASARPARPFGRASPCPSDGSSEAAPPTRKGSSAVASHRRDTHDVPPRDGRVWYPRTPPIAGQQAPSSAEDSDQPPPETEDDHAFRAALADAVAKRGFTLGRELGRGSFGRVYQATQATTGVPSAGQVACPTARSAAIKALHDMPGDSPRRRRLFLREIRVHEKLRHPHIVRLLSVGDADEPITWFAMEYIPGGNLDRLVRSVGSGLDVAEACLLVRQVLTALQYAHAFPPPDGPFVHRDVKPSNILLSGQGPSRRPRLADFGIAKNFELAGLSGMSITGSAAGTLEFMSPEQILDSKYSGPEADIYAMGGVLYYCLTGALMYDLPPNARPSHLLDAVISRRIIPVSQRRPDLPGELGQLIDRAVGLDDVRRFRSAQQMIYAIDQFLDGLPKEGPPIGGTPQ
jgi:hypothetical protein